MQYYLFPGRDGEKHTIITIQQVDLTRRVGKDFENGLIFIQRLAGMLGNRLLKSCARYELLYSGKTCVKIRFQIL